MPPPTAVSHDPAPRRVAPLALFLAFTEIAVSGFGGTLPWSYRVLVETRRWLTDREFMEMLALGQLLPGPNICNVAVMVGWGFSRYPPARRALPRRRSRARGPGARAVPAHGLGRLSLRPVRRNADRAAGARRDVGRRRGA